MSIINSDGLNTNWQLNVLRGLKTIADEVAKPLTCDEDGIKICPPTDGVDVNLHDGNNVPITSTVIGLDTGLDVNIVGSVTLNVNLDAANDEVGIYGYNGATPTPVSVDVNGFVNTNATVTFPSSLPVTQDPASNPWIVDASGSDVTVSNTVTVDATDLDIRNLDCTTDSISICDGAGNPLAIDSTGNINSNLYASDAGTGTTAALTFQGLGTGNALDVFIQGPIGSQDCDNGVAVTLCNTQAQNLLDIKTAVEGTLDVNIISGVTLDVNLDKDNDTVQVYGSDTTAPIATDTAGHLQVDVLTTPGTFREDTTHVSGDTGAFVLAVRNDNNDVMTSANGDYSPIAVNKEGAVAIHDGGGSISVNGSVSITGEVEIINAVGSPIPVILPTGTVTASLERITSGFGTVATGAYSVSFFNAGDQTALVAGQTLNPGERVGFTAPEGKTLGSISYNVGLPLIGEIRDLVISKVI